MNRAIRIFDRVIGTLLVLSAAAIAIEILASIFVGVSFGIAFWGSSLADPLGWIELFMTKVTITEYWYIKGLLPPILLPLVIFSYVLASAIVVGLLSLLAGFEVKA